jgi:hypothetical protein
MWWGTIIGLAIGAWLSYSFILPTGILDVKLAEMTIGHLLRIFVRIFGGLVAIAIVAGIGHLVDIGLGKAD